MFERLNTPDEAFNFKLGANLIINASAADRDEVVRILNRNLESEQAALEKVRALQAEVVVTPRSRPDGLTRLSGCARPSA